MSDIITADRVSRRTFLGAAAGLAFFEPLAAMTKAGELRRVCLIDRRYANGAIAFPGVSLFSDYATLLAMVESHAAHGRIIIGLTCGVGFAVASQVARGLRYHIAANPAAQIEKLNVSTARRSAISAVALAQGVSGIGLTDMCKEVEPRSVTWMLMPNRYAAIDNRGA